MTTFGMANYTSDDGTAYGIRLSAAHYAASGLSTWDGAKVYPTNWTPRVIHGKTVDNLSHISLVHSLAGSYAVGTAIVVGGITFVITGRTGEKRPNSAPAF